MLPLALPAWRTCPPPRPHPGCCRLNICVMLQVTIDEGDGKMGWLLLRASLHDPLLVLNVESELEGGELSPTALHDLRHPSMMPQHQSVIVSTHEVPCMTCNAVRCGWEQSAAFQVMDVSKKGLLHGTWTATQMS